MRALLRRLRSERGMALPLALLVMTVSGLMVVSVIESTSSSGRTATIAKGRMSAEALAEAGIASALSVLNYWNSATMQNNANDPVLLGCNAAGTVCTPRVSTYPGQGTASWYGVLNSTTSTWTITSTGSVANPSGNAALTKTLTARVGVTWNNTQPANASAWNYAYSTRAPGPGCEIDITGSSVVVDVPLYVAGDLCLSGSSVMIDERGEGQVPAPQPIDLRVGGTLVLSGSGATVGLPGDNITSAAVAGGCTSVLGGATHTCARPGDAFYVDSTQTFQTLTQPTADFAGYYASARPGPNSDCVIATNPASLAPTTFDSDTTMNGTSPSFNLTPATSYQCKVYSNGVLVGELSWVAATHVLTARGVIFIDGPITIGDESATYQGSASLYVNGTISFTQSSTQLCANPTCDFTTWNPNTEMLLLVSNATGTAINLNGSSNKFQGGLFCNPDSLVAFTGSSVEVQGPVICGRFTFGSSAQLMPLPAITQLPLGAPMNPNVHATPATPVYGG